MEGWKINGNRSAGKNRAGFNLRGQASLFDGIMFLLIVIFSVTLMFNALNSYAVSQDKVLRTAYLSNYLQSGAKMLYYVDVSTLKDVKSYCDDADLSGGKTYYCKEREKFDTKCNLLNSYKGPISVADLIKRDVDYSDGKFDDMFGTAEQLGRTALRCAMKEIMKPFTLSGYKYLSEVGDATASGADRVDDILHAFEEKYASDYVFSQAYQSLADKQLFDCERVARDPAIKSDQLLVIRTPFKVMATSAGGGSFSTRNFVLRTCVWPSGDILASG